MGSPAMEKTSSLSLSLSGLEPDHTHQYDTNRHPRGALKTLTYTQEVLPRGLTYHWISLEETPDFSHEEL